jgi:hypothetical protein
MTYRIVIFKPTRGWSVLGHPRKPHGDAIAKIASIERE